MTIKASLRNWKTALKQTMQKVEIFLNYIGKIEIPHKETELTERDHSIKTRLARQRNRQNSRQLPGENSTERTAKERGI